MSAKKIRVAVIYGGTNTEHEVSIVSARSIIANLDREKYDVVPIKITKQNLWQVDKALPGGVRALPDSQQSLTKTQHELPTLSTIGDQKIDVIFPVIHGPNGEDGTLQGMLEMAKVAYVGCGVLGSAVCMDKPTQKDICKSADIPIAPYCWFTRFEWEKDQNSVIKKITSFCQYPVFVKPANQGSSVGIGKAIDQKSLLSAIKEAFNYDLKVIVEQGIANVREIECSILGNHEPKASVIGEIIASNEFYDYDAKYVDGKSRSIIPADLPKDLAIKIQNAALKAFQVLSCQGLARADFLLDAKTNQFYLNELNTMPGFTSISMYPKLWQASGVSYSELLDTLITLALENHTEKSSIQLSYTPKAEWYEQK